MNHIYINIFMDRIKFYIINYKNNERRKIKQDEIIIPISFSLGDKLYYIKKFINSLIEMYKIEVYTMKLDDDMGVEIIEAVKIEGVLEELFSCKGVVLWR